jgi:hypothetical protein
MRLVTLDSREAGGRPGILLSSGEILDLAAAPTGLAASQWRPQSVVSVLAEGEDGAARVARLVSEYDRATEADRQDWRRSRRLLPGRGTRLMPPIRRPGLLLMTTNPDANRAGGYVKNPNSAVGPDAIVAMPGGGEDQLFILVMVGIVLGKALYRGTPAQASRAIAAMTLVADLGSRRLGQGEAGSEARQFPGACVLGPALVTVDELPQALPPLQVRVGGRLAGSAPPALDLAHAAAVVSSLSGRYAFRPGDVLGIPAGTPEFELPGASQVVLTLGTLLELDFATAG